MSNCEFRNIVLTGASGGLGRAMIVELAAPGRRFLLSGRDPGRLDQAVRIATEAGAQAEPLSLPLQERDALASALKGFDDAHPVDTLIANAGVKIGNTGGVEPAEHLSRVIDVNLHGAIASTQALVSRMAARGQGRIVLISSLAALTPHADMISYSATKAGLAAYGTALRRSLRGSGVSVSIVYPGFVDTEMTSRHLGPTPLLVPADRAARIILRGVRKGRATIAFPRIAGLWSRIDGLLPAQLSDWLHQKLRADIVPDADEARQTPTKR